MSAASWLLARRAAMMATEADIVILDHLTSGGGYVNTVKLQEYLNIEVEIKYPSVSCWNVIGCRTSYTTETGYFVFESPYNDRRAAINTCGYYWWSTSTTSLFQFNVKNTICWDWVGKNTPVLTVNGTSKAVQKDNPRSGTVSLPKGVFTIFAVPEEANNVPISGRITKSGISIYKIRLFDSNGIDKFLFRAARKGAELGFYDEISCVFYQATGLVLED